MERLPRIAAAAALLLLPTAALAQPPRAVLEHVIDFTDEVAEDLRLREGRFCSQANDLVAVLDAPANVAVASVVIQPELETFRAPPSPLDRDESLRRMVAQVGTATIIAFSGETHWSFFRAPVPGCFFVAVKNATVGIYTVRITKRSGQ